MIRCSVFALLVTLFITSGVFADDVPIASDSRIKTFVYNENEVYSIVLQYGYQTSIEFSEGEEIKNISIGNNYAWQLTPLGRRLFIKPLEENIATNMTVLTNMGRAYQLDVRTMPGSGGIDKELAYVVRFYYPQNGIDSGTARSTLYNEEMKGVDCIGNKPAINFNYTLIGSKEIAPLQVFDNGCTTFFKFPLICDGVPLCISAFKNGKLQLLEVYKYNEYYAVDTVAKDFVIDINKQQVKVHNQSK